MKLTTDIKPPIPFHPLNLDDGWEQAPGAAQGIQQKMLSGELDEKNEVGVRTRLIRFPTRPDRARPVRAPLLGRGLPDRRSY